MSNIFWVYDNSKPPLDEESGRGRSHIMILDVGDDYHTGFWDYLNEAWWSFDLEDWVDYDSVEGWCDPTNYRTW